MFVRCIKIYINILMKCYKCGRLFTSLRQGWARMRAALSKSARGEGGRGVCKVCRGSV